MLGARASVPLIRSDNTVVQYESNELSSAEHGFFLAIKNYLKSPLKNQFQTFNQDGMSGMLVNVEALPKAIEVLEKQKVIVEK